MIRDKILILEENDNDRAQLVKIFQNKHKILEATTEKEGVFILKNHTASYDKKGYENGIVSYIKKPFNPDVVKQLVENVVEFRNLESKQHVKRIRELSICLGNSIMKLYPEYELTSEKIELIG